MAESSTGDRRGRLKQDAVETRLDDRWGALGAPRAAGHAELLNVVETRSATLRHAFYEEGAVVPRHRHDLPTLVYGVGGPCRELSNNRHLIKRRLTYHPAGYEHSLEYAAPTHVVSIEPSQAFAEAHRDAWPSASVPLIATFYDDVWLAMVLISEGAGKQQIDQALLRLLGRSIDFLSRGVPAWLLEVIELLHAKWRLVPSVRSLAAEVGVSPQHVCRAFKKHTGVTLQRYAVQLRLDYARGLLWGTGLSISDIAAETGFSDQSHLTRMLGWHSDRTPQRLRNAVPFEGRTLRLPS